MPEIREEPSGEVREVEGLPEGAVAALRRAKELRRLSKAELEALLPIDGIDIGGGRHAPADMTRTVAA